ncbi:MAG TPA: GNAT family N-acetyltransferase [Casimicrobiaceae bacterium]|nr:GNAT family N-acetyltransferase [Casimicrobiaceae bacterium]
MAIATDATSSFTIEAAGVDDIGVIQALAGTIWRQHYPGIISMEQIDYMLARGYSREALTQFLIEADAGLALAKRDCIATGFVAWHPQDRATMKLEKLYVLPEAHGQGVGRALIEHVIARARDAGFAQLTLNVNRRNTGAIKAYERCGFAIRECGDFPIGNGFVMEDYIMVREIG